MYGQSLKSKLYDSLASSLVGYSIQWTKQRVRKPYNSYIQVDFTLSIIFLLLVTMHLFSYFSSLFYYSLRYLIQEMYRRVQRYLETKQFKDVNQRGSYEDSKSTYIPITTITLQQFEDPCPTISRRKNGQ